VEDPRRSSLFLKDHTLWKGLTLKCLMENCSPWDDLTLEMLMENCVPWVSPHNGAGEDSKKERVAETLCDEHTTTPIPHSPVPFRGRR